MMASWGSFWRSPLGGAMRGRTVTRHAISQLLMNARSAYSIEEFERNLRAFSEKVGTSPEVVRVLFDASWYRKRHHEGRGERPSIPCPHFLQRGLAEGRSPQSALRRCVVSRDVSGSGGLAALREFFSGRGLPHCHDPHPLFDTQWYLEQNPDVREAGTPPIVHFLAHGMAEGRDPHPLFDSGWYRSAYPDVAAKLPAYV